MSRFRDAVELGLAVTLTASTFSSLLVLTALHGAPELPEIAPASAPLTARVLLPPPAPSGPEDLDDAEITEKPAAESTPEAKRRTPAPPKADASAEGLPVPRMDTQVASAGQGEAKVTASSARKGRRQRCLTPPEEIRALGQDSWEVDHSLIQRYMTDLDAAARLARVDWERDDTGEVVGFTIRRLRCGSPLHAAGLRNGDVIHRVNGRDITSIPEALAAYARLKRGDRFRLDISRRGEQRRLIYKVGQG